jgi:arylsulfatase A-like enzyme
MFLKTVVTTSRHATLRWSLLLAGTAFILGLAGRTAAQDPAAGAVVGETYAQSREAPRPAPPVAKGKPNILWILLDDVGFGASSAFGGLINTPTFDRLANNGLRFTNFHTTGVCAPTRAALLTGRNHHKTGMGIFPHRGLSFGFPGYSGFMQPKDGTVAEYLRDAGYSTYALGKWHLTPDEEGTDLGPFDRWPSGKGFQHFFGFLGGATNQYDPELVEDNMHVKPDGRHLNAQLIDKSIAYIDRQENLNPDKPFFLYLATGATHAPHQVDQEWIDKYRGKFDEGWDVFRQEVLNHQKKMGIVPADAKLPPREPRVPAWNSLSADQKKIYNRFMEAYAGYLEYTDHEIGRLISYIEAKGLADNTVIFVMIGDNGASREGGPNGTLDGDLKLPDRDNAGQLDELDSSFDKIGTREALSNYPVGWAQAMDTPFREWKADVQAEGATRNPLIVYWPGHVGQGFREQYGFVTDMLPTALEIAGVKAPSVERGIPQDPLQGASLTYAFADAKAPTHHPEQYYFLFGAGAIVKDGWKASFQYRPDGLDTTWAFPRLQTIPNYAGKEVWQLYDMNVDYTELNDLASQHPDKLAELQALFRKDAKENDVYPLINWSDVWNTPQWQALLKKGAPYHPSVNDRAPIK